MPVVKVLRKCCIWSFMYKAVYTKTPKRSAMSDTFDMDPDKLKQLSIKSSTPVRKPAPWQAANEVQIRQELHRRTMLKFSLLCRKLNIDPLHEKSIHVVLLLFSKIKNKKALLDGFTTHPCCASLPPLHVDWDVFAKTDVDINDVFCAMSDWMLILSYLVPCIEDDLADALQKESLFMHLKQSWKVGGLEVHHGSTPQQLMTAFVYMAPHNLSATKMLERLLLGDTESSRDLEFRCLKMTSHFMDVSVDENQSILNMLLIVPCMMTKPNFFNDMRYVLAREENMTEATQHVVKNKRLQMRNAVKDIARMTPQEYVESFETWLGQQKFNVTMSRHLQLLLYFIQVQPTSIPKQSYSMHFTEQMMERVKDVRVQNIDAAAVITLIKSLRLYHHNVSDLVDFRASCLNGFNQQIKTQLSLAQVLQLYVAAFQHPSIMQACWKAIVPVWSHTTAASVQKFVSSHTFDHAPVIDSVVKCQVHECL